MNHTDMEVSVSSCTKNSKYARKYPNKVTSSQNLLEVGCTVPELRRMLGDFHLDIHYAGIIVTVTGIRDAYQPWQVQEKLSEIF